mgnify:CR=1 FL=1
MIIATYGGYYEKNYLCYSFVTAFDVACGM